MVLVEVMSKTGKSRLRAVSVFQKQPNSSLNPFIYVHYMCVKNRRRGYGLKLAQMMEMIDLGSFMRIKLECS